MATTTLVIDCLCGRRAKIRRKRKNSPDMPCACFRRDRHLHLYCFCGRSWTQYDPRPVKRG